MVMSPKECPLKIVSMPKPAKNVSFKIPLLTPSPTQNPKKPLYLQTINCKLTVLLLCVYQ